MSDLIGRISNELKVDVDTATQGVGAIFSVIKERVGLRTFQMLRVPFPQAEEWIDAHSGIEGYGAGDYYLRDLGLSGPAVDVIERATSSGVDLVAAQKMFAIVYDAIQREAIEPVAKRVADRVPSPSPLVDPHKKPIRKLFMR
jgi:hypothetical protein